jgi:NAD(P)-dependent dehydrogenase (short-subunit alcohol dehydrogenase family)
MAIAGGAGSALVVDHEDPASVAELVGGIERDQGRLDVLVNDIFGGDRYMEWDSRSGSTTGRADCGCSRWACTRI